MNHFRGRESVMLACNMWCIPFSQPPESHTSVFSLLLVRRKPVCSPLNHESGTNRLKEMNLKKKKPPHTILYNTRGVRSVFYFYFPSFPSVNFLLLFNSILCVHADGKLALCSVHPSIRDVNNKNIITKISRAKMIWRTKWRKKFSIHSSRLNDVNVPETLIWKKWNAKY